MATITSEGTRLLELLGSRLTNGCKDVYQADRFQVTLRGYVNALLGLTEYHPTRPGRLNCTVSPKNQGETAVQRALYQISCRLLRKGSWSEITWLDLELPVVPVKASRKRSVDLIAELPNGSSLLVELKFGRRSETTGADYAIFEALTYVAAVQKTSARLAELRVGHPGARGQVDWLRLAAASEVVVAANHSFWRLAKEPTNRERIKSLCREVVDTTGVEVLLREFPDYEVVHRPLSDERCAVALSLPSTPNPSVDFVPVFEELG